MFSPAGQIPRFFVDVRTNTIDAFAGTHHGLITRAIAERLGLSPRAWYRAIATGRLIPLFPGVCRLPGAPRSRDQAILAAAWAVGSGGMASHISAAQLWVDHSSSSELVDVAVARRGRHPSLEGVVLHRPTDLRNFQRTMRGVIPVTTPLRTLIDLGAVASTDEVYSVMEKIIIARLARPQAIFNALHGHAKQGRTGVVALRAALDRYPLALKIADSTMETKMQELANRFGLPAMTFHERILGWEVDFRIDGTPIVLECDGRQHDLDPKQFERDRVRDAELLSAGWVVLRFTWNQLTKQPAKVAARIVAMVEQWAPTVPIAKRSLTAP